MSPRNCGYCQACGAGNYDACTTFPERHAREIVLEALELVAMVPATRGVYVLDQQDMDFVKLAIKAATKDAEVSNG